MIFLLFLLPFVYSQHFYTGKNIEVSHSFCPKGIQCMSKKTFVFCHHHDSYVAYGKKIFACKEGHKCNAQDPYNGCIAEEYMVSIPPLGFPSQGYQPNYTPRHKASSKPLSPFFQLLKKIAEKAPKKPFLISKKTPEKLGVADKLPNLEHSSAGKPNHFASHFGKLPQEPDIRKKLVQVFKNLLQKPTATPSNLEVNKNDDGRTAPFQGDSNLTDAIERKTSTTISTKVTTTKLPNGSIMTSASIVLETVPKLRKKTTATPKVIPTAKRRYNPKMIIKVPSSTEKPNFKWNENKKKTSTLLPTTKFKTFEDTATKNDYRIIKASSTTPRTDVKENINDRIPLIIKENKALKFRAMPSIPTILNEKVATSSVNSLRNGSSNTIVAATPKFSTTEKLASNVVGSTATFKTASTQFKSSSTSIAAPKLTTSFTTTNVETTATPVEAKVFNFVDPTDALTSDDLKSSTLWSSETELSEIPKTGTTRAMTEVSEAAKKGTVLPETRQILLETSAAPESTTIFTTSDASTTATAQYTIFQIDENSDKTAKARARTDTLKKATTVTTKSLSSIEETKTTSELFSSTPTATISFDSYSTKLASEILENSTGVTSTSVLPETTSTLVETSSTPKATTKSKIIFRTLDAATTATLELGHIHETTHLASTRPVFISNIPDAVPKARAMTINATTTNKQAIITSPTTSSYDTYSTTNGGTTLVEDSFESNATASNVVDTTTATLEPKLLENSTEPPETTTTLVETDSTSSATVETETILTTTDAAIVSTNATSNAALSSLFETTEANLKTSFDSIKTEEELTENSFEFGVTGSTIVDATTATPKVEHLENGTVVSSSTVLPETVETLFETSSISTATPQIKTSSITTKFVTTATVGYSDETTHLASTIPQTDTTLKSNKTGILIHIGNPEARAMTDKEKATTTSPDDPTNATSIFVLSETIPTSENTSERTATTSFEPYSTTTEEKETRFAENSLEFNATASNFVDTTTATPKSETFFTTTDAQTTATLKGSYETTSKTDTELEQIPLINAKAKARTITFGDSVSGTSNVLSETTSTLFEASSTSTATPGTSTIFTTTNAETTDADSKETASTLFETTSTLTAESSTIFTATESEKTTGFFSSTPTTISASDSYSNTLESESLENSTVVPFSSVQSETTSTLVETSSTTTATPESTTIFTTTTSTSEYSDETTFLASTIFQTDSELKSNVSDRPILINATAKIVTSNSSSNILSETTSSLFETTSTSTATTESSTISTTINFEPTATPEYSYETPSLASAMAQTNLDFKSTDKPIETTQFPLINAEATAITDDSLNTTLNVLSTTTSTSSTLTATSKSSTSFTTTTATPQYSYETTTDRTVSTDESSNGTPNVLSETTSTATTESVTVSTTTDAETTATFDVTDSTDTPEPKFVENNTILNLSTEESATTSSRSTATPEPNYETTHLDSTTLQTVTKESVTGSTSTIQADATTLFETSSTPTATPNIDSTASTTTISLLYETLKTTLYDFVTSTTTATPKPETTTTEVDDSTVRVSFISFNGSDDATTDSLEIDTIKLPQNKAIKVFKLRMTEDQLLKKKSTRKMKETTTTFPLPSTTMENEDYCSGENEAKCAIHTKIFVRFIENPAIYKEQEKFNAKIDFNTTTIFGSVPDDIVFDEVRIAGQEIPVFRNKFFGTPKSSFWKLSLKSSISALEPGVFHNITGLVEFEAILNHGWKKISSGVFNGVLLEELSLPDNQISEIAPDAFDNMLKLKIVDLSNNALEFYDKNWFKNCPHLVWIYLNSNRIKFLPSMAFQNLNHMKPWNMGLDYNQISEISDEIFVKSAEDLKDPNYFKSLKVGKLSLKGNDLRCLPEKFDQILVPSIVQFEGNILSCECRSKIQEWHRVNRKKSIRLGGSWKCDQRKRRSVFL